MKAENLTKRDIEFINNTARNIATILQHGGATFLSWGASKPRAILYEGKAALRMNVNGFICDGSFVVAYNEGRDLFEVYTFDKAGNLQQKSEDVYFDNLIEVVDSLVETGDLSSAEYGERCNQWLNTAKF